MIKETLSDYVQDWIRGWNRFWFVPRDGGTLGVIRLLVGSMVFYTHLVWTLELPTFMSDHGILDDAFRQQMPGGALFWSHFDWSSHAAWIWGSHWAGLIVMGLFTIGWKTRWTSVITFLLVVSYANRSMATNFGLDQINAFLCLYLAVGDSGSAFSVDAIRLAKNQHTKTGQGRAVSTWNTLGIRLIQIHMCVVYLFAGLGKLRGTYWWNGEAIWGALASHEYQTLDMTWLAHMMWLVNLLTLVAVAWEISYAFLIWNRLMRPIMLVLALLVHLGIGSCMGMMTFGLIMIYGNLAFIESATIRRWLGQA